MKVRAALPNLSSSDDNAIEPSKRKDQDVDNAPLTRQSSCVEESQPPYEEGDESPSRSESFSNLLLHIQPALSSPRKPSQEDSPYTHLSLDVSLPHDDRVTLPSAPRNLYSYEDDTPALDFGIEDLEWKKHSPQDSCAASHPPLSVLKKGDYAQTYGKILRELDLARESVGLMSYDYTQGRCHLSDPRADIITSIELKLAAEIGRLKREKKKMETAFPTLLEEEIPERAVKSVRFCEVVKAATFEKWQQGVWPRYLDPRDHTMSAQQNNELARQDLEIVRLMDALQLQLQERNEQQCASSSAVVTSEPYDGERILDEAMEIYYEAKIPADLHQYLDRSKAISMITSFLSPKLKDEDISEGEIYQFAQDLAKKGIGPIGIKDCIKLEMFFDLVPLRIIPRPNIDKIDIIFKSIEKFIKSGEVTEGIGLERYIRWDDIKEMYRSIELNSIIQEVTYNTIRNTLGDSQCLRILVHKQELENEREAQIQREEDEAYDFSPDSELEKMRPSCSSPDTWLTDFDENVGLGLMASLPPPPDPASAMDRLE